MNLSRIKIVTTIEDFNPNKGYPQFAYTGADTSRPDSASSKASFNPVFKEITKSTPKWKRNKRKRLKIAKRAFKTAFKSKAKADYKPVLLVSTALN